MTAIPGDPGTIAFGVSELATVADTLGKLAMTLDLIADEDVTIGESVDAMRERTKTASVELRKAKPRYETTANALRDFGVALADIQSRVSSAASSVEDEAEWIRYYENEIWEIESKKLLTVLTIPDPEEAEEEARRLANLKLSLSSHQIASATAQLAIDTAVSDWNTAASTASGLISPILGELNDSLLDKFGSFVNDVGAFFAGLMEWIGKFLLSIITTILLVIIVVVAIVVILSFVFSIVGLYFLFQLLTGGMTLDEIIEQLVGITLVLVPILTLAVGILMGREALTPTPTVTPVDPGGRFVDKGDKSDYEFLFDNNGDLDAQGGKDNTVIEIVQVLDENGNPKLDEAGNPIWRVTLPSTQDWQLGINGAFGDNGGVNDLGSNLALILSPEMQAAYERAVTQAMLDAGIGPNDQVMLAGWSQGGILAGAMASDPNSPFNITAIAVAGAPIDHMDIPSDVSVVAIQHDGDHVPRLDGVPPHQGPNWVTVTAPNPSTTGAYPHDSGLYADTASTFDPDTCSADDPNLHNVLKDQSMFFSDNEVAYQYEFSETDSALS